MLQQHLIGFIFPLRLSDDVIHLKYYSDLTIGSLLKIVYWEFKLLLLTYKFALNYSSPLLHYRLTVIRNDPTRNGLGHQNFPPSAPGSSAHQHTPIFW